MNKYVLVAFLAVGVIGWQAVVNAADETTATAPAKAAQVGNKFCPVSGEKIENKPGMETVQMEHNGKLYNLCCSMCVKDFKKDPAKYSKIADDEVAKGQPAAAK
jgi:YHS domain-containing protein